MPGWVRRVFAGRPRLERDLFQELACLPHGERLPRLAEFLHDRCVESAGRFVTEEHNRAYSPFRSVSQSRLFQELLIVNFWILETAFAARGADLMSLVFNRYGCTYVWVRDASRERMLESMQERFRVYTASWNEITGHQDQFGECATDFVFGGRPETEGAQAAFWLISHADRTMKYFDAVAASLNRARLLAPLSTHAD